MRLCRVKLTSLVAGIIVEGEAKFRRGVREAHERVDAARRKAEEERLKRLAAAEAARLEALKHSGALLREAGDIRALVASVKSAVLSGERQIWPDELAS